MSAIITDDPKLYQQIHGFLQAEQPEDLSKLQFYEEQLLPLSKLYSTDIAVERALKEYVWLKNGAYLVIQPTEALTVVDVNSGKYSAKTKKKSAETYLKINLEAAKETARQIRLRNISGIILIDFINMDDPDMMQELLKQFRRFLGEDPIQTKPKNHQKEVNTLSKKELKTNAMRILDRSKISYEYQTYECDNFTDGISTADTLGLPHERVYKTLVTTGKSGSHYVFVIPIEAELDLKKAARAVGEKSVEMLPVREITTVTGYVRGGCTAIGMKKAFPTTIQENAQTLDYIYVSGGKLGMQLKLSPDDLKNVTQAQYADVTF